MVAALFERKVLVTVVHDRSVVGADDDQRTLGETEAVERLHQFADAPVELHDRVRPEAEPGHTLEPFVGHARHVKIVGGEKEKERVAPVGLEPRD